MDQTLSPTESRIKDALDNTQTRKSTHHIQQPTYPMVFCQIPVVLRDAEVDMRLLCGIRTRPAEAGMVFVEMCLEHHYG